MRVGVAFAVGALAAAALAGCGDGMVVRVVDGRPEAGRFISEGAYALYARGADAEERGDLARALAAFQMAAREDPGSPEIWTRIGAVRCRMEWRGSGAHPGAAEEPAFARAEALDPRYAPVHRERAWCLLSLGDVADPAVPLAEARRALALDPDDRRTALVYAAALQAGGLAEDARRAFVEAAVRHPEDYEAWAALLSFARRSSDAALASTVEEHVAALSPQAINPSDPSRREEAGVAPHPPPVPATVDAALVAGDLAEARRRARKARLPAGELAVRAAALGLAPFAREQAALVLGADPADASARLALAAAADLRGDLAALDAAMRGIPRRSTPPSPLARLLFAEVLARRAGAEAARAWLGEPRGTAAGGDDPLLRATEERVRGALALPGGAARAGP